MSKSKYRGKIWTLEFTVIFLFHFIVMFSMYSTLVTVGSMTIENYGAAPGTAGFAASVFIVGVLAGRALTGHQINNMGARKIMYIGTVFFFITYALYFIDGGLPLLIAARFLNGVATGIISTALNTLATISVPPERRGEGISHFSLSMILGAALGPFLSFLALEHISFNMMLIYVLIIVLTVSFLLPLIRINNTLKPESAPKGKFVMIDRDVVPMGFSILFMGLAYSAVLSFLNTYALGMNLVTAAGVFFLVYSAAVLMTRPVTGKILDRYGANVILYPAFIMTAVGFFTLGQATAGGVLLLAGFLIGLGFGNFQSAAQAVCVKVAERENVGLATSTFFIMLEIGLGFGPFFLGMVIPFTGYGGLYQLLVFSIVAAMIIFHFVYGRHEKKYEM